MSTDAPQPAVEIVVVARDQAATLERSVRRLHRHLTQHDSSPWRLTIADHASTDATFAVAEQLADELPDVRAVRIPTLMDRKAFRAQWSSSQADIAAFLTIAPDTDLDRLLDPLVRHAAARGRRSTTVASMAHASASDRPAASPVVALHERRVSRRTALFAAGGLGLTALLAACGGNSSSGSASTSAGSTSPSTTSGSAGTTSAGTTSAGTTSAGTTSAGTTSATTTSGAATTAASATVALAPEMTEGPYYLDLDLVRSNIVEDREGAALSLSLVVVDVEAGAALEGAAVDIWHCDANGLYSGFVDQSAGSNQGATDLSDSGTFLRGTQLTDATGTARFETIYPGWYQGRTVHIHVKVHVGGQEIHTGQLFFDEGFTDQVYAANEPYASRSGRATRNDDDNIFGDGGELSTVVVEGTSGAYTGTLTTGVAV